MTLLKYDRLAIVPKRCDRCNRLFWLEPYNIYYKTIGMGFQSIQKVECKVCVKADLLRTQIMARNAVNKEVSR